MLTTSKIPFFCRVAGRRRPHWQPLILLVLCGFTLAACTAKPYYNQQLAQWSPEAPAELSRRIRGSDGARDPELLVLLAFSGGGTRAASLAYGVLQELAATSVATRAGERRLLDEVDVISSVSGGSFVNAYFGLHGDRIFEDFESRFLRRPVESDLAKAVLKPKNWKTQGSAFYGRSDMAADYYDEYIFDKLTFSDINRPDAPLVIINSTDIDTGARIPFTRSAFDLLCADLASYPLSRAVMASAAVPGAATPITLKNYAGKCGYQLPAWVGDAMADGRERMGSLRAEEMMSYLDGSIDWLHLVDGGISDNLGLRAFYTVFSMQEDPTTIFREYGHENVRHVLIISVNAAVQPKRTWSQSAELPSAAKVLVGMNDVMMRRYAADTVHIVRDSYDKWTSALSTPERPVKYQFVEVTFDDLPNAQERAYFNDLPTSLELEDEQVDRLIAAGRQLLRDAPEFQHFLSTFSVAR